MYRKPRYFFLAFGAVHTAAHPVDGGGYPHRRGFIGSSGVEPGDVMLLYCAGGYPGHDMEAPGIGVVIGTQTGGSEEAIYYQYFSLDSPVEWDTIKNIPELENCTNFTLAGNWLREISNTSFKKAIAGRRIEWP